VVITACGKGNFVSYLEDDYETINKRQYKRKFIFDKFSRHGCRDKILPAYVFYNCENINDIVVKILIKLTKEIFGYVDADILPRTCTQYEINNRYKICNSGEIPMSKCLYEMLISEMNIEVDYFDNDKWNKFNINCYDEFKSEYMKFREIDLYYIARRIINPLEDDRYKL